MLVICRVACDWFFPCCEADCPIQRLCGGTGRFCTKHCVLLLLSAGLWLARWEGGGCWPHRFLAGCLVWWAGEVGLGGYVHTMLL